MSNGRREATLEAPEAAPRPVHRLKREISISTLGSVLSRVLGGIGGIITARLLGVDGKGTYALLVPLGAAIGTVSTIGLQFWISRDVATERADTLDAGIALARRQSLTAIAAITALLLAVGVPLASMDYVPFSESVAVAALAIATVVSMLVLAIPNGQRKMGVVAAAFGIGSGLYVVLAAAMLAFDVASVALVVWAAALANLVTGAVALPRSAWRHPARGRVRTDRYVAALRFGFPAALGELLLLGMFRVDLVIVAAFRGAGAVGLYAVAAALTEVLWIAPDGVALVLLPHVAASPENARTPRLVRATTLACICGGVVLCLAAPLILRVVFGNAFVPASEAVPFLAVAAVALGAWKMIGGDIVARGHSGARGASACVGLIVMVGADLLLVPRFGIAGAGAGSAIGYGAAAAWVAVVWSRATGASVRELLGWRLGDLRLRRVRATEPVS